MEKIEFKSQICTTKEQSQKLLALGLKKETADVVHYFSQSLAECWTIVPLDNGEVAENNDLEIPAWSLHRLMEIMYKGDIHGFVGLNVHHRNIDTIYELVIAHIEGLIKINHLSKDYLEEK